MTVKKKYTSIDSKNEERELRKSHGIILDGRRGHGYWQLGKSLEIILIRQRGHGRWR